MWLNPLELKSTPQQVYEWASRYLDEDELQKFRAAKVDGKRLFEFTKGELTRKPFFFEDDSATTLLEKLFVFRGNPPSDQRCAD